MDLELIREIRHFGSFINVLYVEDDISVQNQVKTLLLKFYNSIDAANNGIEALELYNKKEYDLVITDLKMPKMDGLSLCENIININKEQHILLTSGYKESDELVKLIDIGVAGFVSKPIDFDLFLKKLYNISKKIYASKMMKLHYEEMKKTLSATPSFIDDELRNKDALTSLYNYSYFIETIRDCDKEQVAILVKIADFKLINDYYSFAHGNHLMFQIANILREKASEFDCEIFRISEDEFVFLRKGSVDSCTIVEEEVKNIITILENQRFSIMGASNITISVIASIAKSQCRILESLHQTLSYAKRVGLKYATFKDIPDDTRNMRNVLEVKQLLHDSIVNDTIVPVFQQIYMKNGEKKYEVLMRIVDPSDDGVLISPIAFLDIAKKYRYYNEISMMIIKKALDEAIKSNYIFSINFSYADMRNATLLDMIEKRIMQNDIGKRLIFEIVESDNLDDISVVKAFIKRFKKYGIKIAVDDFGSGYSNFAYIFSLSPDFIKIDGSLIEGMLRDNNMYILVETIVEFAHKLHIEVIAEFVSSKELFDTLVGLKVDGFQGYFIQKPSYLD